MTGRTDRMCLRKKRFMTEITAQAFARNFAGTCGLTPQRAYRCPHCLGWHLTTNQLRPTQLQHCEQRETK
jgi:hypothetical protein